MLFNSIFFIFFFIPVTLIVYYLLPIKLRNFSLLIASLFFYAWGEFEYCLLLITSIACNYYFSIKVHKKKWLIIGLTFNIVLIVAFKYLDFFIENINGVYSIITSQDNLFPITNTLLPLGISFFTFQQMSMLLDIHRNPDNNDRSLIHTALYISFFPQLIAGPIVRYNEIINDLNSRKETVQLFSSGIQKFIIGLFKKTFIANGCASIADIIFNENIHDLNTPIAWLGIIAYTFQIYFDFSGYSDMAIGLGRMFGFRFLENFNFPYTAKSIREFWQRWHISLSTWFRDYVYIPLGGNKKGVQKTYVNLLLVFLLTGLWHGATWSFIFWGMFHGTFLVLERLGFKTILARLPLIGQWSYTILIVMVGWVFFRVESFSEALLYVEKLFGFGRLGNKEFIHYLNRERVLILLLALISSTIMVKYNDVIESYKTFFDSYLMTTLKNVALLILFLYSIMEINSGSYNPFIYFRF